MSHLTVLTDDRLITDNEQGTGSVHELVFDERQPVPSVHSLIFCTVLVSASLRLCFPIDAKAKFYRCQSEGKAKFYRTSIEDLSKTYRRGSGEGAESEQRKKSSRKRDFHPPLSRNRA